MFFEGQKGTTGAKRAGEASSFGERTECKEASKDDTEMHASSSKSAGSSTRQAFTRWR